MTKGVLNETVLLRTIKNASKEDIIYKEDLMHKANAGYATTRKIDNFLVAINSSYQLNDKYSTLVHELGHIYSGHLGTLSNSWWAQRLGLEHDVIEIEAESIAYLVCNRMGLETSSDSYLANYIKKNQPLPNISLDTILTVSNYIEQMGILGFRSKNKK
ncbi:MAG: hypothetical protein IPI65_13565 [Bacteroidetes bacterium]|nr:hypothetical protein [Bacteroidota bacterium]